jgi:MoxR-like ATPase
MTTMQIRDVPEDVHEELVRRAHAARQSLQQYTRSLLISEASRPSLQDILARAAARAKAAGDRYAIADAVTELRAMRDAERHS